MDEQGTLFDKDHLIATQMNEGVDLEWHMPSGYPDLTGYKQIAIDLETCDPNLTTLGPGWARNDGFIVGIAIAAGEESWYFPIRHDNGHNLDPKITMKWLKTQMATPQIDKIMHNATYDLGWLRAEGVNVQGRIIDTMITGAVVDENRWSYSLNNLGKDYLKETKNERMLRVAANEWGIDPKAEMWKLPPKYVGLYAEQDAAMTLRLWERLKIELESLDLWNIWNLETSLIPMMVDMRQMGVRVDLDGADKARRILRSRKKEISGFIKDKTGVAIEPWAAASVQKVFDALNLQYPKTEAGAPSFTKQFLSAHPHEVAQAIVRLRETDKADSTFIDTILKHEHNGRIHTEFHQLRSDDGGTVTGRFSSSNPNLQQIPARDPEIKKLIRGLFIPEDGTQWGSFDYSSQEPRLLVHFAASIKGENRHDMIDEVVRAYNEGDVDLHQMVADFAGITRKEAKVVNLGIMYGMGKGKLAGQLGITEAEAGTLLATHHEKVPFVKGLADLAMQQASKHGVIRTLLGRRCNFHLWEPRGYGYKKPLPFEEAMKEYGQPLTRAFTYKALNKLIQGSAADQTKKAMADCHAEGLLPMLTVHDELCFSVESSEQAARIQEIMETGLSDVLKVPSKVDAEMGSNWGEVG
jgi:DNA polymerase I-like protein with 3'-5' exonuclease and polymerase domains